MSTWSAPGPGDPDLITLRGAQLLREADAVVFDALAPPELLALAPPGALRIDVGKRGHDEPPRSQEEISALLVELAREGRSVVRLKGGDPFVFGRGGEEASACAAAGIAFEVVPGVSSAIGALAYAGIPVTDRRHSASFAVVTGHKDPGEVAAETRWEALALAADTLVILMGMRNLEALLARLLAAGRSPATPAAAVMDGSLPTQRVVVAPLAELAARVREAGLGAPAVVVIGDVVRLRETLRLVREPAALRPPRARHAQPRAGARAGRGAAARGRGARGAAAARDRAARGLARGRRRARAAGRLRRAALHLGERRARARRARGGARRARSPRSRERVFCVGPSTAEAARGARASRCTACPKRGTDGEGLLELVAQRAAAARPALPVCRAPSRRATTLPEGLRAAGARVDAVDGVSHARGRRWTRPALRERLVRGELAALTFTSPSAAKHFAALLDDAGAGRGPALRGGGDWPGDRRGAKQAGPRRRIASRSARPARRWSRRWPPAWRRAAQARARDAREAATGGAA